MTVGILTLRLFLPGCTSLKQKRGLLKPLLARLRREFNLAAAEVDFQDRWQEAVIAAATLSNDAAVVRRVLQSVVEYIPPHFTEIEIADQRIELI